MLDGTIPLHTITPNVDELAALVGAPVAPDVDAVRAAALEAADALLPDGVGGVGLQLVLATEPAAEAAVS